MNSDQIQGVWKQIKGKAQEKWGDLTGDELDKIEGRREQLVGLVQSRYGRAKEEAEREVDSWIDSL
ncbi:CsbD family protein [Gemmobacter caeruleus]|uniref:CsbD family protein n=1 Tax=Gemmobacter caeruleus TaxID=2595004 RepID=UPI0011EDF4B4|nr:CsbD family protein [Gemmobacter caeruleus]